MHLPGLSIHVLWASRALAGRHLVRCWSQLCSQPRGDPGGDYKVRSQIWTLWGCSLLGIGGYPRGPLPLLHRESVLGPHSSPPRMEGLPGKRGR